jgi:hypothetical protein
MSQNLHESPVVSSHTSSQVSQLDDSASISTVTSSDDCPETLTHLPSHVSHTHDIPIQQYPSYVETPEEAYDRLRPSTKHIIVALLSFCSTLAPISSTTILSAIPEVAAQYDSTGTILNLSNALYMLFMGLSPMLWGPLSQVYGRRWVRHPVPFPLHPPFLT